MGTWLPARINDEISGANGIGRNCRRFADLPDGKGNWFNNVEDWGVHINFAPVADINSNPKNPVIGYRSFGREQNESCAKSMDVCQRSS